MIVWIARDASYATRTFLHLEKPTLEDGVWWSDGSYEDDKVFLDDKFLGGLSLDLGERRKFELTEVPT